MCSRGKRSRSKSTTSWPLRASMVAAVLPPGPPPMTTIRLTLLPLAGGILDHAGRVPANKACGQL